MIKKMYLVEFIMRSILRFYKIFFIPFILVSCADKKESEQSCAVQLDEQKFTKVSENTNCTNYERASAYLGRAGMSFSNFLSPGASDNLTKTLGIKKISSPTDYTTGNRAYATNALCLIGDDTFVTSSRCNGNSRIRSSDELEISISANIADFIYLSYGVLDNDSNGALASDEISDHFNVQEIDEKGYQFFYQKQAI